MGLTFPILGAWIDLIILAIVFGIVNKLIQHFLLSPKEQYLLKRKMKNINKEIKQLIKEKKYDEIEKKNKESMALVKEQFKHMKKMFSIKVMVPMMTFGLLLLWVVKKYYMELSYNFQIFVVQGLWAYIILSLIFSIIITTFFDKVIYAKKYKDLL